MSTSTVIVPGPVFLDLASTTTAHSSNEDLVSAGCHYESVKNATSEEALSNPTSPVEQGDTPQTEFTSATPTSRAYPPVPSRIYTLTRSETMINFAELAENTPPWSGSRETPQLPQTPRQQLLYHGINDDIALTITAATGSPHLAHDDGTFRARRKPRPQGIYQGVYECLPERRVTDYFVISHNPFRDEDGTARLDVTSEEMRMLAEVFGESQVWKLNIEDIYCQSCVEMCEENNEADYRHHVEQFLETSPELLKVYLGLRGRFDPGPCHHRRGIAKLMTAVGVQHSKRIHKIHLSSASPGTFQNPLAVASAIANVVKFFPAVQQATVDLCASAVKFQPLIADGVAVRLARAFKVLEKHLPEEEGLRVVGLEDQPVLLRAWVEMKRGWWMRTEKWGRKVLRGDRMR